MHGRLECSQGHDLLNTLELPIIRRHSSVLNRVRGSCSCGFVSLDDRLHQVNQSLRFSVKEGVWCFQLGRSVVVEG
jgi:hypothetical protein